MKLRHRFSPSISRVLLGLASIGFLGGTANADIQWSWSFASEAGYFITDGSLVGGAAPPGVYNVLDFAVTQSIDAGNIGAMSSGELDEGSQPGTGFTWDGTSDTQWFRHGGVYTNGANYYSNVTLHRFLFFPGFYRLSDSNDNPLVSSGSLSLTPGASSGGGYCFGDGSGGTCPCGNLGATGEGCLNSSGAGAVLTASGDASVSSDTLVLHGSQLPANKPGLFFQGTTRLGGGNGLPFGDGLRCAGGSIKRLTLRTSNANGDIDSSGAVISVRGQATAGDTLRYQLWFRDPQGGSCGTGFNLTNGYELVWQP